MPRRLRPQRHAAARFGAVVLFAGLTMFAVAARPAADVNAAARSLFPDATVFGEPGGNPRATEVYRDGRLIGYVFETFDVLRIPAYSGKPINNLVGLDLQGHITGVRIIDHQEPILVVGISDNDLQRYVDQYAGKSAFDRLKIGAGNRPGYVNVDGISGATITVMVENATISRAAHQVAESRGLPRDAPATRGSADDSGPIWKVLWRERIFRIAVLCAGLVLLAAILVFQDWLARRPALLAYLRNGFLVYTVVFIGWYALAQLSVVNVLTFVHSAFHDFRWDNFLIEPMMFLLWGFVAVAVLLWGRGVYCGWLCPYGALQELIGKLGRRLKLPQWELPDVVHERLWALKYIILLALFGMSLQSLPIAERYAEVEPFKTVFAMRLGREWPFVAYAVGLAMVSLVNTKFFCKYLCPLGAALTFPGRFRIFEWLRRRKECGRPCQICAVECDVRAIRPTGEINANECHYCLDCQVTYWNAYQCPPLVERRRRREKSARALARLRGQDDQGRAAGAAPDQPGSGAA